MIDYTNVIKPTPSNSKDRKKETKKTQRDERNYQKTSLLHWALNLISLYLDTISDMPNKIYFTTLKRIVTTEGHNGLIFGTKNSFIFAHLSWSIIS